MRSKLKKALAASAALAVAATAAPFIGSSVASAAAVNNGTINLNPGTGTSATSFGFTGFSSSPSCPGDTASGDYLWSTFMIPAAADLESTLKFGGDGPVAVPGEFRISLTSAADTSAVVNRPTNVAGGPGQPGLITGIPNFTYGLYAPAEIPAGTYRVGLACHKGPSSDPNQLVSYWSKTMTVTADAAGGPAQITWAEGASALAPTNVVASAQDSALSVSFDEVTADPAVSQYTATAYATGTTTVVGSATGAGSPIVISGLTNGTTYDVTVTADNGVGAPAESAPVPGTPAVVRTAPVVTATPAGVGEVDVTWTPAGGSPTEYVVTVTPDAGVGGTPQTETVLASDPLEAAFTGLEGGSHTVTVQAQGYPLGESAAAGTDSVVVLGGDGTPATLIQTIEVEREQVNAIIFEQDCGTGFDTDPCTVDLVEEGPDADYEYFTATGRLAPIRVIDARDTDKGWVVTANIDDTFTDGSKSFDARALGWEPNEIFQSAPLGNGYAMNVAPGATIAPWSSDALKDGSAVLMESVAAGGIQQGLGRAIYDAELSLWIPVDAPSGSYSADIVFTLVNKTP